jgi:hypothetical protein
MKTTRLMAALSVVVTMGLMAMDTAQASSSVHAQGALAYAQDAPGKRAVGMYVLR